MEERLVKAEELSTTRKVLLRILPNKSVVMLKFQIINIPN